MLTQHIRKSLKCEQAPFLIFLEGPGDEATDWFLRQFLSHCSSPVDTSNASRILNCLHIPEYGTYSSLFASIVVVPITQLS